MNPARIVIVGAGQAAAVAAFTLRELGYRGCITMLGRECHKPYERPPLSKSVLVEAKEPTLDVLTHESWEQSDIEFLSGSEVVELDLATRQVRISNGQAIAYDKCLLATGGEARAFARVPPFLRHVHYIRTLDDARKLRDALQRKPKIAILGGGFLGLEVAHSAVKIGASVTVIESANRLLDRFLPREASAWVETELREAGVKALLGSTVSEVHPLENDRMQLMINGCSQLEVDEIVVAVGLTPNDQIAKKAGIDVGPEGGVLVDANCRTSNEHVFACGDCTSQQRPGQTKPSRLESWQNANEQARTAAAAILGAAVPVPPIPWFWTDQGRHNIQMLGLPADDLEYARREGPGMSKVLWIGHRNLVPVHGVAINAGSDLRALRPLFERGQQISLQDFHLDTQDLRSWAKKQLSAAVVTN